MSKYVIDSTTLVAIGDAVREKEGTTEPILVSDLATRISAIETGGGGGGDLPEEAFTITGACDYRFANDGWNWFIENYKKKIKTHNITSATYMFQSCKLESIPFDININPTWTMANIKGIFTSSSLKEIPKVIGPIYSAAELFNNCSLLRELKEEAVAEMDWSLIDSMTSAYQGARDSMFQNCSSLRKYPNSILAHGNPLSSYNYSNYYRLFYNCYALDEIVDLPIQHRKATWTSNAFTNTFVKCYRVKRLTFETNEDGSPIKIDTWSKQAIDLSQFVGTSEGSYYSTRFNAGITEETLVNNDAEYQALKDNPDWWTDSWDYSRYNHDSAVETINTLPDLSGGKGNNTITFKGAAGAKTDGGAINTLTEEEIAVATAKGWTVTLK